MLQTTDAIVFSRRNSAKSRPTKPQNHIGQMGRNYHGNVNESSW